MAASAAKAVWGDNKPSSEEPVSGRAGDTSKGEPYDAGNMEPTSATAGHPASTNDRADADVNGRSDGDIAGDAKFAKTTGTAVENDDTPQNPSTDRKAASVPDDTSKGQGDTRSPEDRNTHPKSAPTDVNDASDEGVNEPQELEGPGPRPVADVARDNGGDAGNDSSSTVASEKKQDKDLEADKADKSENKGTGEQVVRASGLHADGGDFDATKPGAGREADRLMEEKGMHNPNNTNSAGDGGSSSPTSSGKKSFGQKIKDKLHRH